MYTQRSSCDAFASLLQAMPSQILLSKFIVTKHSLVQTIARVDVKIKRVYNRYYLCCSLNDFQNIYYLRLLTNCLTPWSTVLVQKLSNFSASPGITRILWNPKSISVLAGTRYLSLFVGKSAQSTPSSSISISILILSSIVRVGLEVNADKTKYMVMSRDQFAGRNHYMKTDNRSFEMVEEFRHLGTTLTNQNSIQEEIKSRLKSWNACYYSVQNLLSSSLLPKNLKIKIDIQNYNFACCFVWV